MRGRDPNVRVRECTNAQAIDVVRASLGLVEDEPHAWTLVDGPRAAADRLGMRRRAGFCDERQGQKSSNAG